MKQKEIITFLWYELDILGVFDEDVFLRATVGYGGKECIMKMSTSIFMRMMLDYLDQKRDYCNTWDHFCGAAHVYTEKYEKVGITNLLVKDSVDEDKELKYKAVDIFEVGSVEVEMEHG